MAVTKVSQREIVVVFYKTSEDEAKERGEFSDEK